jgi:hypothetical protein
MARKLLAKTLAALEQKALKAHLHNTGFRMVLHAHRTYKGHGGLKVTLSHQQLADMLHYQCRKTPMRHVRALREAGVLDWPPPTHVGPHRCAKNTYTITLDIEADDPAQKSRCDMKSFGAPLQEKMSQKSFLQSEEKDLKDLKEKKISDLTMSEEERLANKAAVAAIIAALTGPMTMPGGPRHGRR